MRVYPLIGLVMLFGLLSASVHASDRATPDDAKAMAIKAAQYLRDAGPEVAFAAFTAGDSAWHDRDLTYL